MVHVSERPNKHPIIHRLVTAIHVQTRKEYKLILLIVRRGGPGTTYEESYPL